MSTRSATGCALVLALLLLPTASAAAGDEECWVCHAQEGVAGAALEPAAFAASVHGALGCRSCHADVEGFPPPQPVTAPRCSTCHAGIAAEYEASVHFEAPPAG